MSNEDIGEPGDEESPVSKIFVFSESSSSGSSGAENIFNLGSGAKTNY
jgi:hypothetical protein